MTVLFQGNSLSIPQFTQLFEQVIAENTPSSHDREPKRPSVTQEECNELVNDCTYQSSRKRKRSELNNIQLRNLRFHDFRDDLLSFICNWKPSTNPTQSMIDDIGVIEICDQEAQTEDVEE